MAAEDPGTVKALTKRQMPSDGPGPPLSMPCGSTARAALEPGEKCLAVPVPVQSLCTVTMASVRAVRATAPTETRTPTATAKR